MSSELTRSLRLKLTLAIGGVMIGIGWVVDVLSPGTLLCGTGFSETS